MLSDHKVLDLRSILLAQSCLLDELDRSITISALKLADVPAQAAQIAELQHLMAEIEASAHLLVADDLVDFDPDHIPRLYEARRAAVTNELTGLNYHDWPGFVRQCQHYALYHGLDPLTPYEALLTESDLKQLRDESYDAGLRCDTWDYGAVGLSGTLAALTDVLLVGKSPATSQLTRWMKQYNPKDRDDWFARLAKLLEDECRVPYDAMALAGRERIAGMGGRSHRLQSLGHDPVLGFVFGVLDIMRGTITGLSYDKLRHAHSWVHGPTARFYEPVGLVEAMLRHIGHLLSDVATPHGLPAPFMTLLQGINAGSIGDKGRTVGELARLMYMRGYDLRHFLVAGLTPAVIEIVLRAYLMLRHYAEHGAIPLVASHPKYRTMLLFAHGIAVLGNGTKVALCKNPLAINVAEWYAFVRYLLPSIKYWVLDKRRLRIEHLEQLNDAGWDELVCNGDALLRYAVQADDRVVELGRSAA